MVIQLLLELLNFESVVEAAFVGLREHVQVNGVGLRDASQRPHRALPLPLAQLFLPPRCLVVPQEVVLQVLNPQRHRVNRRHFVLLSSRFDRRNLSQQFL